MSRCQGVVYLLPSRSCCPDDDVPSAGAALGRPPRDFAVAPWMIASAFGRFELPGTRCFRVDARAGTVDVLGAACGFVGLLVSLLELRPFRVVAAAVAFRPARTVASLDEDDFDDVREVDLLVAIVVVAFPRGAATLRGVAAPVFVRAAGRPGVLADVALPRAGDTAALRRVVTRAGALRVGVVLRAATDFARVVDGFTARAGFVFEARPLGAEALGAGRARALLVLTDLLVLPARSVGDALAGTLAAVLRATVFLAARTAREALVRLPPGLIAIARDRRPELVVSSSLLMAWSFPEVSDIG